VATTPKSVATTPKSVATTPKSVATTLKSVVTTLKSVVTTPKSVATILKSVATTLVFPTFCLLPSYTSNYIPGYYWYKLKILRLEIAIYAEPESGLIEAS
ncbi:hypothetical protein, partial [Nostoc sp. ChiQUE01b]|uniref:hypothetical protein n=1 Tax=Nostoc sp. ChiQUE01b TaxID=3075376 RepID=UPI002AD4DFF2